MKIMDDLLNNYFHYACLPLKYPFKWIGMSKSEELGIAVIWASIVFPILLSCFIYWSLT